MMPNDKNMDNLNTKTTTEDIKDDTKYPSLHSEHWLY